VKIESMEWQGMHEDLHVIPLRERILTKAKKPFVFMGMEMILSN